MTAEHDVRTLNEVERVRRTTRSLLDASWFTFLLWGSLVLASAPFTQIGHDGAAIGIYWTAASLVGLISTSLYYRHRELSLGLVDRNEFLYVGISIAMVIGAMLVGALAGGDFSAVGPSFPIAVGLIVFGAMKRSPLILASGAALAAFAITVLIANPVQAALIAAIGEGAILIGTGLIALYRSGGITGRGTTALAGRA